MKIAIPTDEDKLESTVCVSFGRAPFFLIYDTESKAGQFTLNTAADSEGGAGLKAAQLVVDSGAQALLTVRCGQNAADVLNAAQASIYKTTERTAEDNLKAFENGRLEPMTRFHAGFQGRQ